MAKLLVEHGAALGIVYEFGTNALIEASKSGNAELFEYLVSEGADVNECNEHNPHPVLVACEGRFLNIIEVVLKHGAYVDAPIGMGTWSGEYTSLNLACQRGDIWR